MKEADVNKYTALLIATRKETLNKSRRRDGIMIVESNEQIEKVQLAGEREFAVRSLEYQSKLLMQIDAALQRVDDGEFGLCLACDEPISPKRLAAVPWAAYCLDCQERRDTLDSVVGVSPKAA